MIKAIRNCNLYGIALFKIFFWVNVVINFDYSTTTEMQILLSGCQFSTYKTSFICIFSKSKHCG